MLSTKDVTIVYETLLSSPGMNDAVKVDLRIPRKMVLLLTKAIELGLTLASDNTQNGLLAIIDAATIEGLKGVSSDLLKKAGLTEMNDRLNALAVK
jgi:hypothetical protein